MSSITKHCVHAIKEVGEYVHCSCRKMMHGGLLPLEFCVSQCPYVQRPDFFAQTMKLWAVKAQSGEYRPEPKLCGGCGSVKRRDDAVQFVWPYWHGGASGDEIRWSVRSVETMFQGRVKITIIGDKPPWYHGHYLPKKRVPRHTPNRSYRDMLSKMWVMATHAEIDDQFVWMMDDIYLIKPVSLDELAVPRADQWHQSQCNSWQRRKCNTMRVLQSIGATTHDYATHLPHVVEKAKLREMYDTHDLHHNTMLWEVLYGNLYRSSPLPSRPFFARFNKRMPAEQYAQRTVTASILNHTAAAWCKGVRDFLEQLLPTPSITEQQSVPYTPQFRRTAAVARKVKRRPKHTHKAVIERQRHANTTHHDHSGGVQ